MATDLKPEAQATPVDSGRRPYRFTADQLWKIVDAGIIPEGHFELMRGRIYLMTKHEPHIFAVHRTAKLLRAMMPTGFSVRQESPLRHDRWSVPEPDVAVVPGDEDVFRPQAPLTSEAALIVEVCASTPWSDYRQKANLYAEAGTPTYWVVDVDGRKIDAFSSPRGEGREAGYAEHRTFAEAEAAPIFLDGREVGRIAPRDVLPPA